MTREHWTGFAAGVAVSLLLLQLARYPVRPSHLLVLLGLLSLSLRSATIPSK